jgi:GT2 family glycosyltransferase
VTAPNQEAAGDRPRVDVGVVTWNTAALTAEALRHVLDTDQGCDVRVLVHDNASDDGTPERLRADVPEAEVEAGEANLGFAAGVNRLLARSDAEWFFALNSDAWPEPGALGRLVATAQRRPRAALVAPRVERPDGELEHSTHPFPSARVAGLQALGLARRLPPARAEALMLEGAWAHDREREVDWAVGAAWLLRRSAVDEIGPLDERFFMYAEDLEWCWRARQRGWEVWFDPTAVVRHVGDASGRRARDPSARTAAYLSNTNRFYRSAHGLAGAATYRALNAVASVRVAALAALHQDRGRTRFWLRQARVHLTPARPDRPGSR